MRWPAQSDTKPEHGQTRTFRKFAWRPTVVRHMKAWLEFYQVTEYFYEGQGWMVYEVCLLDPAC